MKILVGISRIIVGLLFIISGLIKLNDPVGFSFKLKEYFAPDVLNIDFFAPYALMIAVILVIVEVLLGVMLLLGYRKKLTAWLLLLMIGFFTFLTFYSAYFNKVTDCGCFGDAIKLTPWQSFEKDIVLLILILVLFFGIKYVTPLFTKFARSIIVFASFAVCLGIAYFVLQHLPIIDFRPYKIGANITEGMTVPEDAPSPIFDYHWKFNMNGEEKTITTRGDYPKVDGKLIGTETEMVQEGYTPPIHDFTIERDGEDYKTKFLSEENLIVVIAYSLGNTEKDGFIPIKEITDEALKKGYKIIGLSASSEEMTEALAEKYKLNFKFYFCDETTLKTIVRSNPGILELEKGTIKQKLHWNDAKKLKLNELQNANPKLDLPLKQRLDSIAVLDQKYRKLMQAQTLEERKRLGESLGLSEAEYSGDLVKMQNVLDTVNMVFIEQYFQKNGYPGKSVVGEGSSLVAWNVLQHNPDRIPLYLPLIKQAADKGEIPKTSYAIMQDRYLMMQGKPQEFGTQGMSYEDARGSFIWPIENPETVNQRRKEAGFEETIEDYAKVLFGEDFVYTPHTMEQVNVN